MAKRTKDYQMAEVAFHAYYNGGPPFEHLDHDYQMRWVRVARAFGAKRKEPTADAESYPNLVEAVMGRANGSVAKKSHKSKAYQAAQKARKEGGKAFRIKSDEQKLADYAAADKKDREELRSATKSQSVAIKARMFWRDRQREALGERTHNEDLRITS
jgi:hypothetical protein